VRGDDGSDDDAIATRAAAGDAAALDELLRRHTSLVHGVCRRVLANPDDALDATQEALLSIARKINTFDGRSRFSTWCYRVATNAALDEARRRNGRPQPVEALPEAAGDTTRIDSLVTDRIVVDAALLQLARVPGRRRPARPRRHGLRGDRRGLDIPAGTVRSRIAGKGRADLLGNQETTSEHPNPRAHDRRAAS
jgi:RNA polymerase sigma-70 factor (ECF subfamily)